MPELLEILGIFIRITDFIQKHFKIINNALKSKLNILKRPNIYNVHQLFQILGLFIRIKDFIQKHSKIINNALKSKLNILKQSTT